MKEISLLDKCKWGEGNESPIAKSGVNSVVVNFYKEILNLPGKINLKLKIADWRIFDKIKKKKKGNFEMIEFVKEEVILKGDSIWLSIQTLVKRMRNSKDFRENSIKTSYEKKNIKYRKPVRLNLIEMKFVERL